MPFTDFDQVATIFDEFMSFPVEIGEQLRDEIVKRVGAGFHTRFLETGVGTGRIAEPFLRAGYNYTGIDLSAAMLARCYDKLKSTGSKAVLILGDMTDMPFTDRHFDVALASSVYRVVRPWKAAAEETSRVLKRPGYFLIIKHEVAPGSMEDVLSIRKRRLLHQFGVGAFPRGGAEESQVAHFFVENGATLETFDTNPWRSHRTPRAFISQSIQGNRVAGQPWATDLAQDLETYALEKYGSLDAEEHVLRHMKVFVLRLS